MGQRVPRSSSVLLILSSSSKGQFGSVRIKIKMSNTFFSATAVKCFTLLRPTCLSSRAPTANSSTPSPAVMSQVLPRSYNKPSYQKYWICTHFGQGWAILLQQVVPRPAAVWVPPPPMAGYSPSVAQGAAGTRYRLHFG